MGKGQDRSFNIAPGANLELTAKYVQDVLKQERPKVLSIRPGYSGIDLDLPSLLQGLPNTFVLLDLIKPFDKEWLYILPAIKYVDAIHCKDTEAMGVTGQKTYIDACEVFLNEGVRFVFLTFGADGALVKTPERSVIQKGFAVDAIDPTGCGDAFCAGVLKKLLDWDAFSNVDELSEMQLEEMLRYGQAVGAACATGIGTTAGVSQKK